MSKVSDASFACPTSRGSYGGPSVHSPSSTATSTSLSPDHRHPVVYELVPLHDLPSLDPTKTVKSLLFSAKQMHDLNRISYKRRLGFSAMFFIGNLLTFAIVTMPASVGQWLSVLAIILQLPGTFFTTMAIRYEMLRLLIRTYDFWFFTVANFMFAASFVLLLGDLRVLALLNGAYLIQFGGIIADAQLGDLRALVVLAFSNIVCHIVLLSAVLFRFVDESEKVVMFRYSRQRNAITTRDMLLNNMANIVMLFTRLWYRKRAALKERNTSTDHRNNSSTSNLFNVNTKCVSYRCHVRLREKHRGSFMTQVESIVSVPASQAYGSGSGSISLAVQLQYSKLPQAFAADDTILARLTCGRIPSWGLGQDSEEPSEAVLRQRQWRRTLLLTMLYLCGIVGYVAHGAAWLTSWFSIPYNNELLQALAVSGSAIFCGTFIALHQVRLVGQLFKSFDFVFLTAKISIGMFCAARFLEWDHKFRTLSTSFVWIYWLLSLDALTPQMRAWLGFRIQFAGPIAIGMITIQILFALDLFWLDQLSATDRILFQGEILGRSIEIHAMSVFTSQLWTILAWFCRILWRIIKISGEDEMVMLLGQVGYDNYMYERKRRRRRASSPPKTRGSRS